ncbi:unnamed protein product, partial [Porites lobata]
IPTSDRTRGCSIHLTQNIGIISNASSQGELSYRISSLHVAKVKLQAQRIYHTKTVCKPCLGVSKTRDAQKVEEFITTLEKSLPQPLFGKSPRKIGLLQGCTPLNFATGEIIQDRTQQMERWVEQDYSELSPRENMVSLEALNAIDCLPVLEDLESEPTRVELKEALGYLHLEKCAARMVILCLW